MSVNKSDPNPSPRILVEGTAEPPSHEKVLTYVGQIVHVIVGGEVAERSSFFFDLCKFGRVTSVGRRSLQMLTCSNCEEAAHSSIHVMWETGYSPNNQTVCEKCILGLVTSGTEHIDFPSEP